MRTDPLKWPNRSINGSGPSEGVLMIRTPGPLERPENIPRPVRPNPDPIREGYVEKKVHKYQPFRIKEDMLHLTRVLH